MANAPVSGSITADEARRIALAAQGFAEPRPRGRVDRRHLRRVLDRVGVIQIDSVNVLARSQELVLFARLGPHPRDLLPAATDAGELFEYWVHEASHVPVDHHHLHRWAMAAPHRWSGMRALRRDRGDLVEAVERYVTDHGPVVAADLAHLAPRERPAGPWWDWDETKAALELLFHEGRVTARRRRRDFARVYDLTERVLPREVLSRPTPNEIEARRELLVLAARSQGIGTLADLCDHHRQKVTACRSLVADLVEDGRLVPVEVDGWDQPAYLHPDARRPRSVQACALLSPFDSLVWDRKRTERLFGFRYRIEIYVPAAKRVHGYYVLPVLVGDRLVGRVDLKSDRAEDRLVVRAAWHEPGVDVDAVADAVAGEVTSMAAWLGLSTVTVERRGDLAPALTASVVATGCGPRRRSAR